MKILEKPTSQTGLFNVLLELNVGSNNCDLDLSVNFEYYGWIIEMKVCFG